MGITKYVLCEVKASITNDWYRFYDTGLNNYNFIALLDTGELVYANTVTFIHQVTHRGKCLGNGVIHDVLFRRDHYYDLSKVATHKEKLLNRKFCIIEYTPEGDRHYGKLLSVEYLKKEFNW